MYVECHIPFNDLRGFVFEKREGMETFMKEVWTLTFINVCYKQFCCFYNKDISVVPLQMSTQYTQLYSTYHCVLLDTARAGVYFGK